MADLSDVRMALAKEVAAIFYPDGQAGPTFPDKPVKIITGWPDPQALEKALHEKPDFPLLYVSVIDLPTERNTSRYPVVEEELARPAKSYAVDITGQTFKITGGQPVEGYRPQNIGVMVDRKSYVLRIVAGRTAAQVANDLAALIAADWPGTAAVSGVITVPQPARLISGRVGVIGETIREVGRTEKLFQVSLWANTDENRAWLGKAVAPVIAEELHLQMPDGSWAYIRCKSMTDLDKAQTFGAFRRDLVYMVEYAITRTRRAPEMIVGKTDIIDRTEALISHQESQG